MQKLSVRARVLWLTMWAAFALIVVAQALIQ